MGVPPSASAAAALQQPNDIQEHVLGCVRAVPVARSSSTVLGAAALLGLIKVWLYLRPPVPWGLLAHGCAGMLSGIAELAGDSALAAMMGGSEAAQALQHRIRFAAITKSVNAISYAYFTQTVAALGSSSVTLFAAAGTSIIASAVQGLFADDHLAFFKKHVAKNVLVFEAFWLTYAGVCALTPAASISYAGLAISGALSGLASTAVASVNFSWDSLHGDARGGLKRVWGRGLAWLRRTFESVDTKRMKKASSRAALRNSIFFVVYKAVYSTLVSA
jgi:hypothetical protein